MVTFTMQLDRGKAEQLDKEGEVFYVSRGSLIRWAIESWLFNPQICPIEPQGDVVTFTVRLPAEQLAQLNRIAERLGVATVVLIRWAVDAFLSDPLSVVQERVAA